MRAPAVVLVMGEVLLMRSSPGPIPGHTRVAMNCAGRRRCLARIVANLGPRGYRGASERLAAAARPSTDRAHSRRKPAAAGFRRRGVAEGGEYWSPIAPE